MNQYAYGLTLNGKMLDGFLTKDFKEAQKRMDEYVAEGESCEIFTYPTLGELFRRVNPEI